MPRPSATESSPCRATPCRSNPCLAAAPPQAPRGSWPTARHGCLHAAAQPHPSFYPATRNQRPCPSRTGPKWGHPYAPRGSVTLGSPQALTGPGTTPTPDILLQLTLPCLRPARNKPHPIPPTPLSRTLQWTTFQGTRGARRPRDPSPATRVCRGFRSRCARSRRRSPCPTSGRRASSSSVTRVRQSAARAPTSLRSTGTP